MKIRMLRSLGRDPKNPKPERLEGKVYDVPDDEAEALLAAKLAEPADDKKAK